ncbi:MAG TPA: hypothetical protein VGY57_16475, partial [Vicinamibacterales bacterium]|nr:hypothetical protein [Vicinamibacterales bacterium]
EVRSNEVWYFVIVTVSFVLFLGIVMKQCADEAPPPPSDVSENRTILNRTILDLAILNRTILNRVILNRVILNRTIVNRQLIRNPQSAIRNEVGPLPRLPRV